MAAGTITLQRLRDLAGFRAQRGCAISLYVDLDPTATPTAGEVDTRFNALLDEGARSLDKGSLTHDEKMRLRADFERIRQFFDDSFDRDGARGLALFAAGDEYWDTLALPVRVPDAIKVRREFHVAPLAAMVGKGDGAVVAVVGRERGEVYELRAGRLEEVVDENEDQPGRHDQGGWSQARYQRHIEKLVHDHYKDVAEALDGQVRGRGPKVVLVATEEQRTDFLETLSSEAREAVVGATSAEAHASPAELLEIVRPILDQAQAKAERDVLERWREEKGRGARAAAGWAETLEAASDARVELLLFAEGVQRKAWHCPQCGRGAAEAGECPLDGTAMREVDNGLDVAVQRTLAHGGDVLAISVHRDLDPVEGIGALLRF
jgi:peptide chain release factor subunit 1